MSLPSVGGCRKDEFQGWQQERHASKFLHQLPLVECTFHPVHLSSSPVWEGHGWMVLNRKYGEGELKGKPANPGLPKRMAVVFAHILYRRKLVCCFIVKIVFSVLHVWTVLLCLFRCFDTAFMTYVRCARWSTFRPVYDTSALSQLLHDDKSWWLYNILIGSQRLSDAMLFSHTTVRHAINELMD